MPIISSPPGANTTLSNLASVAINTSLISDTDSTDNLGSSTKFWANAYIDKIWMDTNLGIDKWVATGPRFTNASSGQNYIGFSLNTSSNLTSIWLYYNTSWSFSIMCDGGNGIINFDAESRPARWRASEITPMGDSTIPFGSSTLYWLSIYTDKLFLNSTATIDGATAGHLLFVGDLVPATDDTEWVGQLETPFKAIKGLILKDTTDGKHYKVTVVSGVLTTTALD